MAKQRRFYGKKKVEILWGGEKLAPVRESRRENHQDQKSLTDDKEQSTTPTAGETEAGSAGKKPVRDKRSGQATEDRMGVGEETCPQPLLQTCVDAPYVLINPVPRPRGMLLDLMLESNSDLTHSCTF